MKKTSLIASLLAAMIISTPALAGTVLQSAEQDGSFKTLLTAIHEAGLEDTLNAAGPFTLFAPNDAAFAKLPKAKLKALMADKEKLAKLISYHIVPSKIGQADVDAGKVKTLEGEDLSLTVKDGVKINNVPMVGMAIEADNGVIHALNSVLIPKK